MKPRLYRRNGAWFCWGWNELGYGETPSTAFQHCLTVSLLRYDFA